MKRLRMLLPPRMTALNLSPNPNKVQHHYARYLETNANLVMAKT
jgi:hypothetical protein